MKSVFKRVAVAAMLAITVMLITMPLGQAASNPVPVPPSGIHQDLSTQAGIDAYFKQHPATQDVAVAIKANVTLTKDGYFATSSPQFAADVAAVNAGLRQFRAQQNAKSGLGTITAQASWCVYLPSWVFHAYIYYAVISGGVLAIMGVIASLTVAGIPVGAVLAVLGISYGMYAFLADQLFQARGYYTWGAWVCL